MWKAIIGGTPAVMSMSHPWRLWCHWNAVFVSFFFVLFFLSSAGDSNVLRSLRVPLPGSGIWSWFPCPVPDADFLCLWSNHEYLVGFAFQWEYIVGGNCPLREPVECVTWTYCIYFLYRVGLGLALWKYWRICIFHRGQKMPEHNCVSTYANKWKGMKW